MSILRKKSRSNYAVIDNEILEDSRLSFRARGMACFLLSKPDDWRINAAHVVTQTTESKNAVLAAMRELATVGYLRRYKERTPDRKNVQTITELADFPAYAAIGTPQERITGNYDQNPDPQLSDPQNPDPQNPDPQNPDPQKVEGHTKYGFIPSTESLPSTEGEDAPAQAFPTAPAAGEYLPGLPDPRKRNRKQQQAAKHVKAARDCGLTPADFTALVDAWMEHSSDIDAGIANGSSALADRELNKAKEMAFAGLEKKITTPADVLERAGWVKYDDPASIQILRANEPKQQTAFGANGHKNGASIHDQAHQNGNGGSPRRVEAEPTKPADWPDWAWSMCKPNDRATIRDYPQEAPGLLDLCYTLREQEYAAAAA